MLRKLGKDFEGSPVAVVFDASGKSFRNDIYPEYKANRPPMPDDLRRQIDPIHKVIAAMGMPLLIVPDVEADDVIGTLAAQATASRRHTVVSTSDKDMAQLVSDYVTLVNTMSETTLDRDGVAAKYGVPPERIVDYLALMGDSVDNIPGVPKVGPKTAAKWIDRFGSLDDVMAGADDVKGKVGENLRATLDQLPLSRELATIRCDVDLPVALEDLVPKAPDEDALAELFTRFEFRSWLAELGIETDEPPPPARDYVRVTDPAELGDWTARLREAGRFALAVHTDRGHYMDARIAGLSIAVEPGAAAYVPVGHDLAGAGQLSLAAALEALRPLLEDAALPKVGHNLKAARNVLERHGVALAGIASDTMLESYVLDSVGTRRHSLEALATKHLRFETTRYEDIAGKGAKQLDFPALAVEAATDYAAEEADVALRLHEALWPRLEATGRLRSVYEEIELPLLSVLSRVEQAGALVDAGLLAEQGRELGVRVEALAEQAYEAAGRTFNLGSPKQLQEVLYDEMGLTPLRKTQTGQRSTAEAVLQEYADRGEALPEIILNHRQVSKLKSTYTDTLPQQINQRTGRIHTTYGQAVAATGRLASQDPNLQNIPIRTDEGRRIRQAFVARPAASSSRRTTPRSSCASWPTCRGTTGSSMRSRAASTCTARRRGRYSASAWTRSAATSAAAPRRSTSGSSTACPPSASGGSCASRATWRRGTSTAISRATRACASTWRTRGRRRARRASSRRCTAAASTCRRSTPASRRAARRRSARRSTRRCRAPPPTSSSGR